MPVKKGPSGLGSHVGILYLTLWVSQSGVNVDGRTLPHVVTDDSDDAVDSNSRSVGVGGWQGASSRLGIKQGAHGKDLCFGSRLGAKI